MHDRHTELWEAFGKEKHDFTETQCGWMECVAWIPCVEEYRGCRQTSLHIILNEIYILYDISLF